jgi:hypothetical protein
MNSQQKFLWQYGDLRPDWLSLAPESLQFRLAQLLAAADTRQSDKVHRMLAEAPWPTTIVGASDRLTKVIEFLVDGPS